MKENFDFPHTQKSEIFGRRFVPKLHISPLTIIAN